MPRALLVIISIILIVLSGCSSQASQSTQAQVDKLAPDFQYTDNEGGTVSFNDLRGKTVILNFWATWCGPCRYEMPLLQDLFNHLETISEDLVLLTINVGESSDTVDQFMAENGYSLPVILDTQSKIAETYNIRYFPTTYFIGQDGVILYVKPGAFQNQAELKYVLDTVMK